VSFRCSFTTDIAADDDYSLFADSTKCHDHAAVDVPTTELEQESNNDNHMVNVAVIKCLHKVVYLSFLYSFESVEATFSFLFHFCGLFGHINPA